MATNTRTIDRELQLGFLIHDTSRLRRSALDRHLKPLNVTRSQWWVLAHLSRKDGVTQKELADQLDLGQVAIGGLIDRLEKNGLVTREADPHDRRVNRIYLDARSKPLLLQMRQSLHAFNAQLLEGLTDVQLATTAEALELMKANLLRFLEGAPTAPGQQHRTAAARARSAPAT